MNLKYVISCHVFKSYILANYNNFFIYFIIVKITWIFEKFTIRNVVIHKFL